MGKLQNTKCREQERMWGQRLTQNFTENNDDVVSSQRRDQILGNPFRPVIPHVRRLYISQAVVFEYLPAD